jgi:hypothetical protein
MRAAPSESDFAACDDRPPGTLFSTLQQGITTEMTLPPDNVGLTDARRLTICVDFGNRRR